MKPSKNLIPTYPYFPIQFESAEGEILIDTKGKKYLDFFSGISCTNLGHNFLPAVEALTTQAEKIWYHSNYFCHPKTAQLAEKITNRLDFEAQVFFGNSGAEANEGALKLARRYTKKNKNPQATEIIAFEGSFHGRTMGTLSCTGKKKMREDFAPLLEGVFFAQYNDIESVQKLITPNTSSIIIELIQGEGGVNIAEKKFIQELRAICNTEDIVLIFDEIQSGIGRTGKFFAFEHYGVQPDIFTLAKALANGFPIGAFIAKKSIAEAFGIGDHGTTFGGNPLACAVGCAVIEAYTPNFLESVEQKSKILEKNFLQLQKKFPQKIFSVRGKGLIWGIEMPEGLAGTVQKNMVEEKNIMTLTADNGNVWRLLPPLTISDQEVENFFKAAQKVLGEV